MKPACSAPKDNPHRFSRADSQRGLTPGRGPRYLSAVVSLVLALLLPVSLQAQDSSAAAQVVVRGVVMDESGAPTSTALDFWLDQKKLGSAVSEDDGAFEVKLQLDASADDALLRVSSDNGHANMTIAQAVAGATELRLQSTQADAGMPLWLRTFFSVILPIVVLAIVILAIRNRKRVNASQ